MNVATLHYLLESFEEDKRYYNACSPLAQGREQRDEYEHRARMITRLIAQIRGEIFARESPGARAPGEAQGFEDFLQRALKDYPTLDQRSSDERCEGSPFEPFVPRQCEPTGIWEGAT